LIKFLHAADLHLDSPFAGLSPEKAAERRKEQRGLLQTIADCANENGCELLLLAGDLFDSDNAYPDTLEALSRAFASCQGQIVIAPGNHDCAVAGSAYRSAKWPENVHIFLNPWIESFDFPRLGCRVYGAGFVSPYQGALLEGFSAPADGYVNLMVLHGDATNPASEYNPVSREQIASSSLAYLALGHVHAASGLLKAGHTYYAWPGCAMGRGFDETGPKGVYIGETDGSECRLHFCPLPGRRYEILRVPAYSDFSELPANTENDIYRIILTGEAEAPDLPAIYRSLQGWFYSLSLRDETTPPVDLWAGAGEDTLKGLFLQALKKQYDAAEGAERRRFALAAEYGLAAMEGREAPET
jgi:exonuclease SbcD